MKCPYHDTCAEYGCPELCRCFCDSDDISYTGLHPKLIWHRTKTLGRGDDRCDFCMKTIKWMHRNEEVEEGRKETVYPMLYGSARSF